MYLRETRGRKSKNVFRRALKNQCVTVCVIIVVAFIAMMISFYIQDYQQFKAQAATSDQITAQAMLVAAQKEHLSQALLDKLDRSAHMQVDNKTKAVVEVYLQRYFGSDWQTAEKVFTCESGLSPNAYHKNSDKSASIDRGVAQLNDHWQQARFEKMTGVKFDVGAHDIDMNLKVAAAIYKEQGFKPWMCSPIVGLKV